MATTKPCPGCKEVYRDRKADEVCDSCKRLIQEALKQRELDAKEKEDGVALFQVPWFWPDFYQAAGVSVGGRRGVDEAFNQVQKAFADALIGVGEHMVCGDFLPRPGLRRGDSPEYWQQRRGEVIFPEKMAGRTNGARSLLKARRSSVEKIVALDTAVRQALGEVAKSAYENGHSLLAGLASGKMSVQDFNAATLDKKQDD